MEYGSRTHDTGITTRRVNRFANPTMVVTIVTAGLDLSIGLTDHTLPKVTSTLGCVDVFYHYNSTNLAKFLIRVILVTKLPTPNTTQPHIYTDLRQPPMIVGSRGIVTNYLPSTKIALALRLKGSNFG